MLSIPSKEIRLIHLRPWRTHIIIITCLCLYHKCYIKLLSWWENALPLRDWKKAEVVTCDVMRWAFKASTVCVQCVFAWILLNICLTNGNKLTTILHAFTSNLDLVEPTGVTGVRCEINKIIEWTFKTMNT